MRYPKWPWGVARVEILRYLRIKSLDTASLAIATGIPLWRIRQVLKVMKEAGSLKWQPQWYGKNGGYRRIWYLKGQQNGTGGILPRF